MFKLLLLVPAVLLVAGCIDNDDLGPVLQKIASECRGTVSLAVSTGSDRSATVTCTETLAERSKKDESKPEAKNSDGKQAP